MKISSVLKILAAIFICICGTACQEPGTSQDVPKRATPLLLEQVHGIEIVYDDRTFGFKYFSKPGKKATLLYWTNFFGASDEFEVKYQRADGDGKFTIYFDFFASIGIFRSKFNLEAEDFVQSITLPFPDEIITSLALPGNIQLRVTIESASSSVAVNHVGWFCNTLCEKRL
jgi:hypothetical protein